MLVITGNTSRLVASVCSYHTVSYCWCFLLVRSIHSTAAASSFNRLLDLHGAYEFMPLCPSIVVGRLSCCCSCSFNSRSSLAYLSRCITCHGLMVSSCLLPHQTVFIIQIHSCGSTALSLLCGFVLSFRHQAFPESRGLPHCLTMWPSVRFVL
jgi:hypothetical protein